VAQLSEYPTDCRKDLTAVAQGLTGDTAQAVTGVELTAAALTARGVPTKTGNSERWTYQAVARIVRRNTPA
jgi:hypothetical protein